MNFQLICDELDTYTAINLAVELCTQRQNCGLIFHVAEAISQICGLIPNSPGVIQQLHYLTS